jgi:predicted N-acetyltransferase YhbS
MATSTMRISTGFHGQEQAIIELFAAAFTASEGPAEGARVGELAHDLLHATAHEDLVVVTASESGAVVGCVAFSRMTYDQDDRTVFLLAPVAVATHRQGRGIGQALVRHGLATLGERGVDLALTLGDPRYYGKVGFRPVPQETARAPFELRHPEAWLARWLSDRDRTPLRGSPRCVEALNRSVLW